MCLCSGVFYSERRRTFVSSIMQGELMHPYLKINVRRSHIIEDTLIQVRNILSILPVLQALVVQVRCHCFFSFVHEDFNMIFDQQISCMQIFALGL